eukprot:gene15187-16753_t
MELRPMNNKGYAKPSEDSSKVSHSQRMSLLIIFYLFTFMGFTLLAISQATTSWTIIDNFKDHVHFDEYRGLWQTCKDKPIYECSQRTGLTWLYLVRAFTIWAFLMYAIVAAIFIGSHVKRTPRPSIAATFLLVAALFVLIGMIIYTAKAQLPRTVNKAKVPYITREFTVRYGYSYFLGWAGLLLTFMAGIASLSKREKTEFRKVFDLIDEDGSGKITKDEFSKLMKKLNQETSADNMDKMFNAADKDGSGAIDFDEFLATFESNASPPSKSDLEESFKMIDKNGDGFLSREEIKAGLAAVGEPLSDESVDEMLAAADTNHDGKISYEEFTKMLKG